MSSRCGPPQKRSAERRIALLRGTNADALMAVVETTLATGPTRATGPQRHRVLVHLDARSGEGHLHDGPDLSPATTARLCCDAEVFGITTADDGGRTDAANLCLLCRRHHRAVHSRGYQISLVREARAVRRRRPR